jgi:hypothetical protein
MGTPLPQQITLVDNAVPGKTMKLRIQNPPPNLGIKTDVLVKSQKWDGKVKSAKCKACES